MQEAELDDYLGGESLASGSGLIASLLTHPARLYLIDEFGQHVKAVLDPNAAWHKREVVTNLTTFWSSCTSRYVGVEYADQREKGGKPRKVIEHPHPCVYGSTVPGTFWGSMRSGNLGDGSVARFLVFETPLHYPDPRKPAPWKEGVEAIAADLRQVANGAKDWEYGNLDFCAVAEPSPYPVPVDADAEALLEQVTLDELELKRQHQGTPFTAIVARFREQTGRVALTAAVAEDPAAPRLTARHVAWAKRVARACVDSVMSQAARFVSDSEHEKALKRLLEAVRGYCTKHGGWMSGYELANRTRWLEPRRREELLGHLEEAGDVEIRSEQTRLGRKPRRWVRAARR
jgi:hypothetical protein